MLSLGKADKMWKNCSKMPFNQLASTFFDSCFLYLFCFCFVLLHVLASEAQDYVHCKEIILRVEISKFIACPVVIFKKSAVGLLQKEATNTVLPARKNC
jgi:hypothetical protein